MIYNINMQYSILPLDVVHNIFSYTGIINFRYGKYMNRIPKTDPRYKLLENTIKHRLYDFDDNTYSLYVGIKKDTIYRFINITIDFENERIEYCYHRLLHSESNAYNVRFICPI